MPKKLSQKVNAGLTGQYEAPGRICYYKFLRCIAGAHFPKRVLQSAASWPKLAAVDELAKRELAAS